VIFLSNDFYGKYKNALELSWRILIKYNINKLPISLHAIIEDLEINMYTYEDAQELINELGLTHKTIYKDGFSAKYNNKWYIFYNGNITFRPRIRFTVAHELGHILLGYEENLSPTEENEVDIFASRLLAPACLIWAMDIHDWKEIAKVFGISEKAAKTRATRMKVTYARNMFLTNQLEKKVYEQFKPFIEEYLDNK
jgi:Zn-dependent peptidase ImmA (M78 family)